MCSGKAASISHAPYEREDVDLSDGYFVRTIDEPTSIDDDKVFADEILSNLPYREVTRRLGIVANGVMIDDQRVIMVSVSFLYPPHDP